MGRDRFLVAQGPKTAVLNIGCGTEKFIGGVNVDAFDTCDPDIVWDLSKTPWTWAEDETFDIVYALHVMEHITDWWGAFSECARVLKVGGKLEIRVPCESSSTALAYRDHLHVFTPQSFHGIADGNNIIGWRSGTNAWAMSIEGSVPFKCIHAFYVPFPAYEWMLKFPRILRFCASHLRNFVWENVFIFERI